MDQDGGWMGLDRSGARSIGRIGMMRVYDIHNIRKGGLVDDDPSRLLRAIANASQ